MSRLVRTPVAGPFSLAGAFAVLAIVYACGPSDETPEPPNGSNDGSLRDGPTAGDASITDVGATNNDSMATDANVGETGKADANVGTDGSSPPPPPPSCGKKSEKCCVDQLCNQGLVCAAAVCTEAVKPAVCAPGAPAWAFVSEIAPPAKMQPYERFTQFATFRNCSGFTVPRVPEAAGAGIKLGFSAPRDYDPFGLARIALPADVPNANDVTIPVVLRAPPLTGGYYLRWGLVDEGKAWLPAESTAHGIDVQSIPQGVTICPGVAADIGGVLSSTVPIQTCINNTPAGGILELPGGVYRIDGELTIAKAITIRTLGSNANSPGCWDHESPACAVLRGGDNLSAPRGFVYVTAGSDVHLDRIVLDGNRNARLSSAAAATCAGGTNGAGFNAHSDDCANCSFKRGMSARALCGTGWEWIGDNAVIEGNVFYQNGDHNTKLMWADGLTLLRSNGSKVLNNRFVDNSDIDFISGGANNALFEGNSVVHILQPTFAGLMLDNFNGGTPGTFIGASMKGNTVNCGNLLCDFGIELGPHAWYLSANIQGGSVTGNVVVGAKIQINAEGAGTVANPVTVSGNFLGGTPGTAKYGCGQTRTATQFNVSPDSVVATTDKTAGFTYHVCP